MASLNSLNNTNATKSAASFFRSVGVGMRCSNHGHPTDQESVVQKGEGSQETRKCFPHYRVPAPSMTPPSGSWTMGSPNLPASTSCRPACEHPSLYLPTVQGSISYQWFPNFSPVHSKMKKVRSRKSSKNDLPSNIYTILSDNFSTQETPWEERSVEYSYCMAEDMCMLLIWYIYSQNGLWFLSQDFSIWNFSVIIDIFFLYGPAQKTISD